MSDMTSVFAEITKTAPQEDGSLLVYGKATGSDLDLDGQRCDSVWLQSAMPEFMRIGNVREQHDSKRAVGKAFEHEVKDDGHYIRARIVDPIAVAKTRAGIFTGFSIGVSGHHVSKSADAPNGVIDDGKIVEISLVDRPALPTATLTVCKTAKPGMQIKSSDFDSERLLVRCEELVEKDVNPDMHKAGEMTVTLADQLAPEVVEKLVEKTTDVDHLEAPAPGQVCADCNEDGHLNCGPTDKAAEGGDTGDKAEEIAESDPAEAVKTVDDAQQAADDLLEVAKGAADEVAIVAFDREAAKALVVETLAKAAADGLGQDESGDISGADQAIALIAQLVISEAQDLAKMPAQGCDIHLLMSAVDALRCFSRREQIEQAGADPDNMFLLAAEADAEKAEVAEKAADIEEPVVSDDVEATKTVEPEAVKAAVFDAESLLKALEGDLEKADSPLRELLKAIAVKATTELVEASTKSAAEALGELGARLEKVEGMATPGGPALRRTEVERVNARRNDLAAEAARFKAMAANTTDQDLRTGYATKAAQMDAEIKALAA